MSKIEFIIERLILSSRWLLVVFYLGLAGSLAVYAVSFFVKFAKVAMVALTASPADMLLSMLSLVDAALVASLIVMVMISGYENFVSRFDDDHDDKGRVSFLGKLDSGSLKVKVASSIVAISSIRLLEIFLNEDTHTLSQLLGPVLMQLTFVVSALLLGVLEKIIVPAKPPQTKG